MVDLPEIDDIPRLVEATLRRVVREEFLRPAPPAADPVKLSPTQLARAKLAEKVRACEACGWVPPPTIFLARRLLHHHHVLPRALGGSDDAANRVIICPNCHAIVHAEITRVQKNTDPNSYTGPRTREELLERLRAVLDGARSE